MLAHQWDIPIDPMCAKIVNEAFRILWLKNAKLCNGPLFVSSEKNGSHHYPVRVPDKLKSLVETFCLTRKIVKYISDVVVFRCRKISCIIALGSVVVELQSIFVNHLRVTIWLADWQLEFSQFNIVHSFKVADFSKRQCYAYVTNVHYSHWIKPFVIYSHLWYICIK